MFFLDLNLSLPDQEWMRLNNSCGEVIKSHKLTDQKLMKMEDLWPREFLNQQFGEVVYGQGTQAWSPDLRAGNCNKLNCWLFSDCCNHLLITVITLTFNCNINSCAGHLFGALWLYKDLLYKYCFPCSLTRVLHIYCYHWWYSWLIIMAQYKHCMNCNGLLQWVCWGINYIANYS